MKKPEGALIAIIDDDAAARDAVTSLVSAMGYRTFACDSAATFLSSELRPMTRCVITDVRMPGMGGLNLYHLLVRSTQPVPMILMTAYPDETTRASALSAGLLGYLVKPCDPDALLVCLREAVRTGAVIRKLSPSDPTE